jgi:hypothetical protein
VGAKWLSVGVAHVVDPTSITTLRDLTLAGWQPADTRWKVHLGVTRAQSAGDLQQAKRMGYRTIEM